MKLSIIIPTYNEKENIPLIIDRITNVLNNKKIDYKIIIVDDNSPDGTGDLAEELSKTFKDLIVIHRKGKLGIGGAYIEGFKFGLNKLNSDLFITMDADLSHNPKYILDLLEASKNYDVVIG